MFYELITWSRIYSKIEDAQESMTRRNPKEEGEEVASNLVLKRRQRLFACMYHHILLKDTKRYHTKASSYASLCT